MVFGCLACSAGDRLAADALHAHIYDRFPR